MYWEVGAILVLDDNDDFRELVASQLRRRGHRVTEADNTVDGFELALEMKPDLILSDVLMGDGDGLSLLKEIRAHPEISTTPFIVMTGQPDSEGMLKGAEDAADGYLPKPFSMPTLFATVENRLGREERLRKGTEEVKGQLHQILQASPDLIGILDPQNLQFLFLNAAGRAVLEMSQEAEAHSVNLSRMHPEEGFDLLQREGIPQALRSGLWKGENTLLSASGRRIAVKQSLQAHRGPGGGIAFLSTIAHDLTEQKEVEGALRESEVKFRSLINSLPDAVIMHESSGRILFSNVRAEEFFGFSSEEFEMRPLCSLWKASEELTPAVDGRQERSCLRRNGEEFPAAVLTSDLQVNGRQAQLTIVHDLSVRKELERERDLIEVQLRQALKLESIGQLAAGIAHEINTPTQYIGDNIRFLRDSFAGIAKLIPEYKRLLSAAKGGAVPAELIEGIEKLQRDADIDYMMEEGPMAVQQSLEGVERVSEIVRAM
jgi:PAS domain S-box-containing protein